MAYVISDDCISCGTCEGECPAGAISEGDGKYEIDADTCMDCGSCAGACPAGAISQEYFVNFTANYYKRTSCLRCLLFLFVENRKRILPHKRTDFVTFALRRSDCSLAGSFLSETVLSGRTERLTQGNKTVLLCGKIPFLFSSVCQIPFRLFFRKNRLFFLKIPSLETAISCLAFWVLRMASSSFL